MTRQQVDKIISHQSTPHNERVSALIETLISWVIVCEKFTYKIKRPVRFSFLDFSTLERRKNFCLQEYYLNRQLAGDMYVDVLPVTAGSSIRIGGDAEVIDYAVRMRTLDNGRLMSELLQQGEVTADQVDELAGIIAEFHENSPIIYSHAQYDLTEKFNDISVLTQFQGEFINAEHISRISSDVEKFKELMIRFVPRLIKRINLGFFRDCHGDLHSGNIFLTNRPIPFDRIEFDHELREIDVLNEIAFICMDLEYYNQPDLSKQFFETYNTLFPAVLTKEDEDLFMLYKAYRANICAKVNCLKAQNTAASGDKTAYIKKSLRYLDIMNIYLREVDRNVIAGKQLIPRHISEMHLVPYSDLNQVLV